MLGSSGTYVGIGWSDGVAGFAFVYTTQSRLKGKSLECTVGKEKENRGPKTKLSLSL